MCDDDNQNPPEQQPEFKPGETVYCQFGNQILNNNVPWADILQDILRLSGKTHSHIAAELNISINSVKNIVNGNDCPLDFGQGARLLRLHHEARIYAGVDCACEG